MKRTTNKPGRPAKSGSVSLMLRHSGGVERRSRLRAYLSDVRAGLIEDLGPREENLTTAELILVDRIISKLCVLRAVEERISEQGIFGANGDLKKVLGANYLAYSNSIRLSLQALGIGRRTEKGILDLTDYIRAHDAKSEKAGPGSGGGPESAGTASGQAEGSEGGAIARPGASVREISEEGHDLPNSD